MNEFDYSIITDPEIFQINRCKAHSDNEYGFGVRYTDLNGTWKFHFDNNINDCIKDFYGEEFSADEWDDIKVPGNVAILRPDLDPPIYTNVMYPWDGHEDIKPGQIPSIYNPVYTYIRDISLTNEGMYKSFIRFDGVESAFALWVNGTFVGYSEDSFDASEFDITNLIKEGNNRIAVQVFKWCAGSWIEDQDFWRMGGIFRDVTIYSIPDIHVNDVFVKTRLTNNYTDAVFNARINFLKHIDAEGYYVLEIKDKDEMLYTIKADIMPGSDAFVVGDIKAPRLWSAEKPNLYDLVISVYYKDATLVERYCAEIGFRQFELIDGIMHINGKRIMFSGVDRHDFSHVNGRAVTKEEMLWDVLTMKQSNINAVRTSHYPNQPYFYKLCDEYGIYLIAENNMETHGLWAYPGVWGVNEKLVPDDKPEWLGMLLDRASSLVESKKNHPSVLIWSCGNESFGGENIFKMSKHMKSLDETRLVHYEGIFNDRRFDKTSDMESQMYTSAANVEKFLNEHPEKPFILCEYSHAMGNSCGGHRKYTELAKRNQRFQGGFIWDFIDQAILHKNDNGEDCLAIGGDFCDRPNDGGFCTDGIVFADRTLSPKIPEIKHNYQNIDCVITESKVTVKNYSLFTNTDEYDCVITMLSDGKFFAETFMETSVEPLETAEYDIPDELVMRLSEIENECTYQISFRLKEDTSWAEKGHEVAFDQYSFIFGINYDDLRQEEAPRVEFCDNNIGVYGKDYSAMFNKFGGLISYTYKGVEYLRSALTPNFWRAPVDNDNGSGMCSRDHYWKIASLYMRAVFDHAEMEDDHVVVKYHYEFPTSDKLTVDLTYKAYNDGKINVVMEYEGSAIRPEMPEFGIIVKTTPKLNRQIFCGYGPEENYIDRNNGYKLGIYEVNVAESLTPYLNPQECANHTGLRYTTIVDENGYGLYFSSNDAPSYMEGSVLPVTPHELENAKHAYELPPYNYTVVKLSKMQMGIAGDDSWGARPHEEYTIASDQNMKFEFNMGYVK